MLPSKKLLSLPIISLKEGQQIGFVRNLVVDPKTKAVAAFIVDPKGFFKEQRIIPFNRVVSIGKNAITVSTESQVEKATNLPDILELLKEKAAVIGIKIMTENGKNLGFIEEFFIDPKDGSISSLEISGGKIEGLFNGKAKLLADDIVTIGPDVIVVARDAEDRLEIFNKGINENVKSLLQTASAKVSEKGQMVNQYWKKKREKDSVEYPADYDDYEDFQEESQATSAEMDTSESSTEDEYYNPVISSGDTEKKDDKDNTI